ncbi:MAG: TldD/PmbA family protein [Oligoflexales bacterium]
MKNFLQDIVNQESGFVELRYHAQQLNNICVTRKRTDSAHHQYLEGIAVRVHENGHWGFSATSDLSKESIQRAIYRARQSAAHITRILPNSHKNPLRKVDLYKGSFISPGYEEIQNIPFEEKISKISQIEREAALASSKIHTASCRYEELIEHRIIITSDGAQADIKTSRPTLYVRCFAQHKDKESTADHAAGITGSWSQLLQHPQLINASEKTAKKAIDLLCAPYVKSGTHSVILSPALVGLLCHEAIGHTVEADFVKAGSVAQGRLNTQIASEHITLIDEGSPEQKSVAGYLPCDDEGVITKPTHIIEKGQLKSYLHDRTSATEFETAPTGNSRAFSYIDEPMIRMTNTYLKPGKKDLDEMISEIPFGYLAEGDGGGEADSNGEFQFGCGWLWEIKNGRKTRLIREANLSGLAFEVLQSVDAVSTSSHWDMGSGYCYKGQKAKVDAGGPHIRCKLHIGGQSCQS